MLRQICSQEWVLQRCLQHAEELCQRGFLLDEMLTAKQVQRLLHMICYPEIESNLISEMDQKSIISRILEVSLFLFFLLCNLSVWRHFAEYFWA